MDVFGFHGERTASNWVDASLKGKPAMSGRLPRWQPLTKPCLFSSWTTYLLRNLLIFYAIYTQHACASLLANSCLTAASLPFFCVVDVLGSAQTVALPAAVRGLTAAARR